MSDNLSLREVVDALESLAEKVGEIENRLIIDGDSLSFEQKVIRAARFLKNGDPLKDVLSQSEIETAIQTLADVYTVTGVLMPAAWD
jgi:cell division protein YceG involved in septum cleavage